MTSTEAPTVDLGELERLCNSIIEDAEDAAKSRHGSDARWRVERWAEGTEEIARALLHHLRAAQAQTAPMDTHRCIGCKRTWPNDQLVEHFITGLGCPVCECACVKMDKATPPSPVPASENVSRDALAHCMATEQWKRKYPDKLTPLWSFVTPSDETEACHFWRKAIISADALLSQFTITRKGAPQ